MIENRKRPKVLAALVAAAMLLAGARADAASTAGIRQAIDAAIENNLTSRLAKADSDAARARAIEAAAYLLPSVIGTASQNRIFKENLAAMGLSGGSIPPLIGPYDSFDARLRLTQLLFDVSLIKRYQAVGAAKELAVKQEEVAREQVAAAAALAYVDALRAQKAVAAAQADLELADRLQAQAEDQRRAGTATGVDVIRAKTRSAEARVRFLQSEVARRNATIRLQRVAGWPLGEELTLSDDLKDAPVPALALDAALSQAVRGRPELAAADLQLRLDEDLLGAERAQRLPSIVGTADLGLSGNKPDSGARTTGSIGAGLSIPIFSGGLLRGRVQEAKAELDRSQARLADARRQVEEDVRLALQSLGEAHEQVDAAAQTRDLAQRQLTMANDRYAAGTSDNVAVVAAQTDLALARDGYVASLAADYVARINLAAALGAARAFQLQ